MATLDDDCITCEEAPGLKDPEAERCPKSQRPCGHHCNHSWSHDECDWCGKSWEPEGLHY